MAAFDLRRARVDSAFGQDILPDRALALFDPAPEGVADDPEMREALMM